MAPAAAIPVPSIMGTEELAVFDGLPIHHVHGTNDWMFDISQVREADGRAADVLGSTWSFTELSDWTHASPAKVGNLTFLLQCEQQRSFAGIICLFFSTGASLPGEGSLLSRSDLS